MADPKLLADAVRRKIDIEPLSGEGLHALVGRTLAVSPAALAHAKATRKP